MSSLHRFFPRERRDVSLVERREQMKDQRERRLDRQEQDLVDREALLNERERAIKKRERAVEREQSFAQPGEGCGVGLSEVPGTSAPGMTDTARLILQAHAMAMGKTTSAEPSDPTARMIVQAANGTFREERPKPLSQAAELIVRANSLRLGEEPLSNGR
jgi:hypothetical protein